MLKLLQAISLYSGLLELLTELNGDSDYTTIYVATLWRLWVWSSEFDCCARLSDHR